MARTTVADILSARNGNQYDFDSFDLVKEEILPALTRMSRVFGNDVVVKQISNTGVGVVYGVGQRNVTADDMTKWGVNVEDLHDVATKNLMAKNDVVITTLDSAIGMSAADGGGLVDSILVLTNKLGNFGSVEILLPSVVDDLRSRIPGGFYVIPSSLHELLIIPKSYCDDISFLREMVRAVNATEVAEKDILADEVFLIDDNGNLAIA